MNFAGFGNAFQGASDTTDALQRQQVNSAQIGGNNILAKIIQQYAASQPPAPAAGPAGGLAASNPGMPQPGGVSPPAGVMPPVSGAPGGSGPFNPMGGAPSPGNIDLQKLIQAVMASGGSNGAQGNALQSAMRMLQPQANAATRLNIATMNNDTREDIANKNIDSRQSIADANRLARGAQGAKLKDDPVYRALEDKLKSAQSANAANGTEDTYKALTSASQDLLDYAKSKDTTAPTKATESISTATSGETDARVHVVDKDGNEYTIPGSQLDEALKQGYTKK